MSEVCTEPSTSTPTDPVQVARQAIFDRDLNVYGYELLYRGKPTPDGAWNGDQASSITMLHAYMDIGIERIVGPHRAFINLTHPLLTQTGSLPLAPEQAVLEILEDVNVDQALLDGLGRLKQKGYTIALDDYQFDPVWEPVLPLVDIIKVDVMACDWDTLSQGFTRLRRTDVLLLAEKVENPDEFQRLHDLGFDLFQGYFFARPSLVQGKRLSENRAVVLQLLARLNDPTVSIDELEELIVQDPALSYKILRYANSAAFALRSEIDSIHRAIVLLGTAQIRGWANLLAMAGMDDKPRELLHLALLRAHLCRELTQHCPETSPETGYTVGLFSLLDALLNQPMDELLGELPFPGEIAQAIGDRQGPYGVLLVCAADMEKGSWDSPACQNFAPDLLAELYVQATQQTFRVLQLLN